MKLGASLLLALALAVVPARAAEPAPLVVKVDVGASGLSADVIRTAIGKELGVATSPEGATASSLSVRLVGSRARVSFVRKSGEKLEREIDLPAEPSSRVEVIALLAGNLARDEAAALIASLKKPEPEPAPPAEPAPAPVAEQKPADPPAKKSAEPKPEKVARRAPEKHESSKRTTERGPLLANLSLYHPISITSESEKRSFNVELGLAYSRIGGLDGFGLTLGHLRVEGPARGVGIGVLWTRLEGNADGAFGSAIFSEARGRLRGAEGSGVVLLRKGKVEGFQSAGALVYTAGDVEGAQLSIVNVGADVTGAQVGIVNVGGHVRGSQVGLVNVADRVDGLPLGVVNVIKEGRTQALAWADTQVIANVGVKYLNGPLYTVVAGGFDGGDGAGLAFALGGHIQLGRASYLELDALYRYVSDFDDRDSDPDQHFAAGRLIAGLEGLGPTGAFAGGGVSYSVDAHGQGASVGAYGALGVALF